jgi:WD40 repeat protein
MMTTTWKQAAVSLLTVGIVGIGTAGSGANDDQSAGAARPAAAEGKTDRFGDPLPEGALARMGTLRWRHGAPVSFVGYTAHGKQLLTACTDGFFRVWDVASGKELRRFGNGSRGPAVGGAAAVAVRAGVLVAQQSLGGAVALSADGKTLAAAGGDGVVRLWEVATGKELRMLRNAPNPKGAPQPRGIVPGGAANLAFSPDGKMLATRGRDHTIHLWDIATGRHIRQMAPPTQAGAANRVVAFRGGLGNALVFLPDGKSLVSAGLEIDNGQMGNVIRLFDVASGNAGLEIKGQDRLAVGGLAVAADGKTLAVGGGNSLVRLYDLASGKEVGQLGQQRQGSIISSLVFAPTGNLLALCATNSAGIQLWDVAAGKELRRLGEPGPGNANVLAAAGGVIMAASGMSPACVFSPDGKQLADVSSGNTVRLWDVASGKEILPASGHHGGVSSLSVSPDGKVLTTFGADRGLRQWEVSTGKELRQFPQLAGTATVVFAADGKLATCHGGGTRVILVDLASGKIVRSIQPSSRTVQASAGGGDMALSSDGKLLAIRGFDQVIRLFSTATGQELRALREQPPTAGVIGPTPLVFSPDGTTLASVGGLPGPALAPAVGRLGAPGGNGNAIRLWNVAQGSQPRIFQTQSQAIVDLAFSPDGRTIVTANNDHSLSLWEVYTGREYLHISPDAAAPPAPPVQATVVRATPAGGFARLGGQAFLPIAIAPDGRTLAMGSTDRSVRLWDLRTGKALGQFKGHNGPVLAVAFAPDSRTVLSGSADTTALVWDGNRLIHDYPTPVVELDAGQVEALWQDLAADPVKAFRALGTLRTAPPQAVALCQERLKATAGVEKQQIERLIADLDNAKFSVRQKAMQELEKLGELAMPALQKLLDGQASLEMRRRVEKLLEEIATDQTPPPDDLRALRALQVLEQVGTPEARQVLRRLADGAPGAKLTRHAAAALLRSEKRS